MNLNNAKFEMSYGLSSQIKESNNKEIIIMGRSNVGKSTLINALLQRRNLARVSSSPGKTATINVYNAGDIDIIDLPGYGYAKKSKSELDRFKDLIGGFFDMDRKIALVLLLIDMRHKLQKSDLETINFLIDGEYPFVIVLTKEDKLKKSERDKNIELIKEDVPYSNEIRFITTSAKLGKGIEYLKETIKEAIEDCL